MGGCGEEFKFHLVKRDKVCAPYPNGFGCSEFQDFQ